ncbi:hypothetical protein LTS16_025943 [Friedmanniomyces endolithicus]|nr:hypothetical protein LTR57_024727 [Friedmanniomyces endolithicus]KAK1022161.1 hypothetical protein LTS16_025943 [Friedmanniomyces endolithicus]
MKKLYYVSNLFYILILGLVKSSAALYIVNLTIHGLGSLRHVSRQKKYIFFAVLALDIAWTIASVAALALRCGSEEVCVGTMWRWRAILVGDVATDVLTAVFAGHIIWRIQASLRASVPICAGPRLATINQRKLTIDPMLMLWLLTVLSQIHIFLSMLGGTSPALKKTMLDLVTNYGGVSDGEADSRAKAYGRSFPMKDMKSHQRSSQASTSKFVPFVGGASSNIATVKNVPDREDRESQEGIISRCEFEISYESASKGS